jgi:hypothetical protein
MTDIPEPEDIRAALILAEEGELKAQLDVAYWYLQGQGVVQNSKRAAYWYQKAAEAGSSHAQFMLAMRYKIGDGVEQDYTQAFYWFEKAAKEDLSYSLCEVGIAYFEGHGVKQDNVKAVQCFKTAYDAGNVLAAYYYGRCLLSGLGVKENIQSGMNFLREAANAGNEEATQMLNDITQATANNTPHHTDRESPVLSFKDICTAWGKLAAMDVSSRLNSLRILTDSIERSQETITADSAAVYINILRKAAQVPSYYAQATKILTRLIPEHLKLTGRSQVNIIREIESHDLGKGLYYIGDPAYLKELPQWANQRSNHYLVEMINAGKLLAYSTQDSILGKAQLRLVECDEPVLFAYEYKQLRTASPTIIIKIESGSIGIFNLGTVAVKMPLQSGNYKICAYQLGKSANFYIIMCKTSQQARNDLEVLPDLSS